MAISNKNKSIVGRSINKFERDKAKTHKVPFGSV